ncbi:HAD superfamily hydrolase, putative [Paecilomyces variotii No. 5]|uniref:HAD superfamily hydrolase, putative n=1 Tax=Byssochlamys spectabilis (strain No. 5 / NBRC 109023) TaxID=1356009 RepID=V5I0U2_BYSSN|nr:HAD superfamily hydrolase, putative [Paecilomyces variotii No. 5]
MDGLLINTEDIITQSTNKLLEKYGRPTLPRWIRVQLMGVSDSTNGDLFHNWAKLPISRDQFARESTEQMRRHFPNCRPLHGAEDVLENLSRAFNASGENVELVLATGTKTRSYELKTSNPETSQLIGFFQSDRRILGDDPRVPHGRGKPAPDIYLVALQSLNSTRDSSKKPISPNECLVFEDSVAGVEAARRAGMRVVWVPHPDLVSEYQSRQEDAILARGREMVEVRDKEFDGSWLESIPDLEHFSYEKYGLNIRSEGPL